MKIKFRDIHLSKANLTRLDEINSIIESYQEQGYLLTLRQLYYQLVSRDVIPNNVSEYGKLSNLLKEGRMSGIVDWDAIEDRLRKPDRPPFWESPQSIIDACAQQYRVNRMSGQNEHIAVWVEKDALSGVLKRVTQEYGIQIVVNRGYSSATAMFDAHERFLEAYENEGQNSIVIYIGDFDPSGQDMIRDITDRISEFKNGIFCEYDFKIMPIALTWSQIEEFNPPPNPAKITDPRAKAYILKHGPTSWEVDALRPETLHSLLENTIRDLIDSDKLTGCLMEEKKGKTLLQKAKKFIGSI
jgi:hypothetical protein